MILNHEGCKNFHKHLQTFSSLFLGLLAWKYRGQLSLWHKLHCEIKDHFLNTFEIVSVEHMLSIAEIEPINSYHKDQFGFLMYLTSHSNTPPTTPPGSTPYSRKPYTLQWQDHPADIYISSISF